MNLYNYRLENKYLRGEVEKLKEKNTNLKKMLKENQSFESSILSTKNSEYEVLYKEKCEDFDVIENRFESISNKFNLILENMTNYQNSLLADNMRLKDTVLFLIRSFNEKEYENINYLIKYMQENDTFLCTNEEKSYSSIIEPSNTDHIKHKKEAEEDSFYDSVHDNFSNKKNNKNGNDSDSEKNSKYVEMNFSDLKMKNTIPSAKRNNSACRIINHDKFKVNNYSDLQNRNSNMNNNKSSMSSLNSPNKLNIYDKYQLSSLDRYHVKVDEHDKSSNYEASNKYSDKKRYSSKQNDREKIHIPRDTYINPELKELMENKNKKAFN